MFALAIALGLFSYWTLTLGVLGMLSLGWIWGGGLVIFGLLLYYKRSDIFSIRVRKSFWTGLIIGLAAINLIGALGPELGFDALW